MVYMKDTTNVRAKTFTAMIKDVIWIDLKDKMVSHTEICMGFTHNAPHGSQWYNPNFNLELEEVNSMQDLYPLAKVQ
jgi:hypothetical protein